MDLQVTLILILSFVAAVQSEPKLCNEAQEKEDAAESRAFNRLNNLRPGVVFKRKNPSTNSKFIGSVGVIHGAGGVPNGGTGVIHGGGELKSSLKRRILGQGLKNSSFAQKIGNLINYHNLGILSGNSVNVNSSQENSSGQFYQVHLPNGGNQVSSGGGGSGTLGIQGASSGGIVGGMLGHGHIHGLHHSQIAGHGAHGSHQGGHLAGLLGHFGSANNQHHGLHQHLHNGGVHTHHGSHHHGHGSGSFNGGSSGSLAGGSSGNNMFHQGVLGNTHILGGAGGGLLQVHNGGPGLLQNVIGGGGLNIGQILSHRPFSHGGIGLIAGGSGQNLENIGSQSSGGISGINGNTAQNNQGGLVGLIHGGHRPFSHGGIGLIGGGSGQNLENTGSQSSGGVSGINGNIAQNNQGGLVGLIHGGHRPFSHGGIGLIGGGPGQNLENTGSQSSGGIAGINSNTAQNNQGGLVGLIHGGHGVQGGLSGSYGSNHHFGGGLGLKPGHHGGLGLIYLIHGGTTGSNLQTIAGQGTSGLNQGQYFIHNGISGSNSQSGGNVFIHPSYPQGSNLGNYGSTNINGGQTNGIGNTYQTGSLSNQQFGQNNNQQYLQQGSFLQSGGGQANGGFGGNSAGQQSNGGFIYETQWTQIPSTSTNGASLQNVASGTGSSGYGQSNVASNTFTTGSNEQSLHGNQNVHQGGQQYGFQQTSNELHNAAQTSNGNNNVAETSLNLGYGITGLQEVSSQGNQQLGSHQGSNGNYNAAQTLTSGSSGVYGENQASSQSSMQSSNGLNQMSNGGQIFSTGQTSVIGNYGTYGGNKDSHQNVQSGLNLSQGSFSGGNTYISSSSSEYGSNSSSQTHGSSSQQTVVTGNFNGGSNALFGTSTNSGLGNGNYGGSYHTTQNSKSNDSRNKNKYTNLGSNVHFQDSFDVSGSTQGNKDYNTGLYQVQYDDALSADSNLNLKGNNNPSSVSLANNGVSSSTTGVVSSSGISSGVEPTTSHKISGSSGGLSSSEKHQGGSNSLSHSMNSGSVTSSNSLGSNFESSGSNLQLHSNRPSESKICSHQANNGNSGMAETINTELGLSSASASSMSGNGGASSSVSTGSGNSYVNNESVTKTENNNGISTSNTWNGGSFEIKKDEKQPIRGGNHQASIGIHNSQNGQHGSSGATSSGSVTGTSSESSFQGAGSNSGHFESSGLHNLATQSAVESENAGTNTQSASPSNELVANNSNTNECSHLSTFNDKRQNGTLIFEANSKPSPITTTNGSLNQQSSSYSTDKDGVTLQQSSSFGQSSAENIDQSSNINTSGTNTEMTRPGSPNQSTSGNSDLYSSAALTNSGNTNSMATSSSYGGFETSSNSHLQGSPLSSSNSGNEEIIHGNTAAGSSTAAGSQAAYSTSDSNSLATGNSNIGFGSGNSGSSHSLQMHGSSSYGNKLDHTTGTSGAPGSQNNIYQSSFSSNTNKEGSGNQDNKGSSTFDASLQSNTVHNSNAMQSENLNVNNGNAISTNNKIPSYSGGGNVGSTGSNSQSYVSSGASGPHVYESSAGGYGNHEMQFVSSANSQHLQNSGSSGGVSIGSESSGTSSQYQSSIQSSASPTSQSSYTTSLQGTNPQGQTSSQYGGSSTLSSGLMQTQSPNSNKLNTMSHTSGGGGSYGLVSGNQEQNTFSGSAGTSIDNSDNLSNSVHSNGQTFASNSVGTGNKITAGTPNQSQLMYSSSGLTQNENVQQGSYQGAMLNTQSHLASEGTSGVNINKDISGSIQTSSFRIPGFYTFKYGLVPQNNVNNVEYSNLENYEIPQTAQAGNLPQNFNGGVYYYKVSNTGRPVVISGIVNQPSGQFQEVLSSSGNVGHQTVLKADEEDGYPEGTKQGFGISGNFQGNLEQSAEGNLEGSVNRPFYGLNFLGNHQLNTGLSGSLSGQLGNGGVFQGFLGNAGNKIGSLISGVGHAVGILKDQPEGGQLQAGQEFQDASAGYQQEGGQLQLGHILIGGKEGYQHEGSVEKLGAPEQLYYVAGPQLAEESFEKHHLVSGSLQGNTGNNYLGGQFSKDNSLLIKTEYPNIHYNYKYVQYREPKAIKAIETDFKSENNNTGTVENLTSSSLSNVSLL